MALSQIAHIPPTSTLLHPGARGGQGRDLNLDLYPILIPSDSKLSATQNCDHDCDAVRRQCAIERGASERARVKIRVPYTTWLMAWRDSQRSGGKSVESRHGQVSKSRENLPRENLLYKSRENLDVQNEAV